MDWLIKLWGRIAEHESLLAWIGGISLATLVASAFAVPMLIRRIPPDYFLEDSAGARWMRRQRPAVRIGLLVMKNLLGLVFVAAGFIMLFTPGQGLLTLVAGVLLLDFPGKRRFEIWLMRRRPVYRAIDWIRRRASQPSLELPDD